MGIFRKYFVPGNSASPAARCPGAEVTAWANMAVAQVRGGARAWCAVCRVATTCVDIVDNVDIL